MAVSASMSDEVIAGRNRGTTRRKPTSLTCWSHTISHADTGDLNQAAVVRGQKVHVILLTSPSFCAS